MNGRKYEELEDWEKAFFDLNKKIGNDAWGAAIEGDGSGNSRMRIYLEKAEFEEIVLKETKGKVAGYPLVFTVLSQEAYAISEHKRELERAAKYEKEKEKTKPEAEKSSASETV